MKLQNEIELQIRCRTWFEDSIWNAEAIDLPIAVFGKTFKDAYDNMYDAVIAHIEIIKVRGELEKMIETVNRNKGRLVVALEEGSNKIYLSSSYRCMANEACIPLMEIQR